ncbi:hypothetical protein Tco_1370852 [Tanacetum coccineum]
MVFSVASHKEEGSSSNPTPTIPIFDLRGEIVKTIGDLTFEKRAKLCYQTFLTILLKNHGLTVLLLLPFESFTIGITFNAEKLLSYVVKSQFKDVPPHSKHLLTMLQWFVPHHQWTRWLTTIEKETYVLVMFRRPGSFLPPRAVNDDGSVMYHSPYFFIHDWYKVNPSSRRCERKLRTLYADTRSLMARANGVDPDKIPYYVMWNISLWSKDNPDAYKWIKENGQWLYYNFDHCDVETSDDDDDARSLWSSDDDEHFDPFEDDPTHPDARWSDFARNSQDKKRSQSLIQALNQVEPDDVSDLESLYSLDDEPSDSVLCTIAYSDFSSDDDSDSDSLESDYDFGVHMINPIPHVLPIQEDPPLPLAKIHLLTDAYAKPIPVIAFFDTGSSVSILNPNILPDHY